MKDMYTWKKGASVSVNYGMFDKMSSFVSSRKESLNAIKEANPEVDNKRALRILASQCIANKLNKIEKLNVPPGIWKIMAGVKWHVEAYCDPSAGFIKIGTSQAKNYTNKTVDVITQELYPKKKTNDPSIQSELGSSWQGLKKNPDSLNWLKLKTEEFVDAAQQKAKATAARQETGIRADTIVTTWRSKFEWRILERFQTAKKSGVTLTEDVATKMAGSFIAEYGDRIEELFKSQAEGRKEQIKAWRAEFYAKHGIEIAPKQKKNTPEVARSQAATPTIVDPKTPNEVPEWTTSVKIANLPSKIEWNNADTDVVNVDWDDWDDDPVDAALSDAYARARQAQIEAEMEAERASYQYEQATIQYQDAVAQSNQDTTDNTDPVRWGYEDNMIDYVATPEGMSDSMDAIPEGWSSFMNIRDESGEMARFTMVHLPNGEYMLRFPPPESGGYIIDSYGKEREDELTLLKSLIETPILRRLVSMWSSYFEQFQKVLLARFPGQDIYNPQVFQRYAYQYLFWLLPEWKLWDSLKTKVSEPGWVSSIIAGLRSDPATTEKLRRGFRQVWVMRQPDGKEFLPGTLLSKI